MAYNTPKDELDAKVKHILQEFVDKESFAIFEYHKTFSNPGIRDEIYTGKNGTFPQEIVDELCNKLLNCEIQTLVLGYTCQISSALGNMLLFQIKKGTFKNPIILF